MRQNDYRWQGQTHRKLRGRKATSLSYSNKIANNMMVELQIISFEI